MICRAGGPADAYRFAKTAAVPCQLRFVFPFYCSLPSDPRAAWSQHQAHKLRLLSAWRDASERRLAALNAAISTLEQQIARDQAATTPVSPRPGVPSEGNPGPDAAGVAPSWD